MADIKDPDLRQDVERTAEYARQAAQAAEGGNWITMLDERRPILEKKLKSLAKLASKVGVAAPTIEIGEEVKVKVYDPEDKLQQRVLFYVPGHKIKIVIPEEIKFSGDFEVLAKITQVESGANLVNSKTKDNAGLPQDLWTTDMHCEHCGKARKRKTLYYVEDLATGERKKIGSACVDDFTGHPGMEALASAAFQLYQGIQEFDDEPEEEYRPSPQAMGTELRDALAFSIQAIRENGKFVSRANEGPGNPATADVAAAGMTTYAKEGKGKPNEAEYVKADEIIAWLGDLSPNSDFEANLKTLSRVAVIQLRQMGYVAAMVPAYERATGAQRMRTNRAAEQETAQAGPSDPYRPEEIGKKTTFTGILEFKTSFDTPYGTKTLLKFKDEVGRNVTWSASGSPTVTLPKMSIEQKVRYVYERKGESTIPFRTPTDEVITRIRNGEDLGQDMWTSPERHQQRLQQARSTDINDPQAMESLRSQFMYVNVMRDLTVDQAVALAKSGDVEVVRVIESDAANLASMDYPEKGKMYQVTGTIKAKDVYRGEPQTSIQRAAITPVTPLKAALSVLDDVADVLWDEQVPLTATLAIEEAYALLAAADRNHSLVVHIPLPKALAALFPDAVHNHGHEPHATVCFVTKDPTDTIEANVLHTIRKAVQKIPPFTLQLDVGAGLQDFGEGNNGEKALWFSLNAEPNGMLSYLHRVIRQALEEEGLPCEAHDTFKGHVTWRYVPNDISLDDRNRIQQAAVSRVPAETSWNVRAVVVSTTRGDRVCMLNPKALVPAIVTRGALSASASSKKKQNDVLTHLYWAGRRGADLEDDVSDLEEAGLVRTVKTGKKLTKEGVARFAKISKKKAELVEKGVRNH